MRKREEWPQWLERCKWPQGRSSLLGRVHDLTYHDGSISDDDPFLLGQEPAGMLGLVCTGVNSGRSLEGFGVLARGSVHKGSTPRPIPPGWRPGLRRDGGHRSGDEHRQCRPSDHTWLWGTLTVNATEADILAGVQQLTDGLATTWLSLSTRGGLRRPGSRRSTPVTWRAP